MQNYGGNFKLILDNFLLVTELSISYIHYTQYSVQCCSSSTLDPSKCLCGSPNKNL